MGLFSIIQLDTGTKRNSCGRGVEQLAARRWRFRHIESKVGDDENRRGCFQRQLCIYRLPQGTERTVPKASPPNHGLIL